MKVIFIKINRNCQHPTKIVSSQLKLSASSSVDLHRAELGIFFSSELHKPTLYYIFLLSSRLRQIFNDQKKMTIWLPKTIFSSASMRLEREVGTRTYKFPDNLLHQQRRSCDLSVAILIKIFLQKNCRKTDVRQMATIYRN